MIGDGDGLRPTAQEPSPLSPVYNVDVPFTPLLHEECAGEFFSLPWGHKTDSYHHPTGGCREWVALCGTPIPMKVKKMKYKLLLNERCAVKIFCYCYVLLCDMELPGVWTLILFILFVLEPETHSGIRDILNFVQIVFFTSTPQDFDKFAQNFVEIILRPSRINLLIG